MYLSADAMAVLAAEAFVAKAAVRSTCARHVRVADAPMVLVPMALAGEDGAPLAFAWGRGPSIETMVVVPEPRDRDEAWQGLEQLAEAVCAWLDPIAANLASATTSDGGTRTPAPAQLVLSTPAAVTFLRKVAYRLTHAPDDSPPVLRRAGGWLQYFLDRHELAPWDSALLVATKAVGVHWTLPLAQAESAHLLAVEACLASPGDAIAAAHRVEYEPGGTLTMPEFDEKLLQPAIEGYGKARGKSDREDCRATIASLLHPLLSRSYDATWALLEALRAIPPIPSVLADRADSERAAFERHHAYLEKGGRFAAKDSLARSILLLDDAEETLRKVRQDARATDALVRAVAASDGEALDGTITAAEVSMVKVTKKRSARIDLDVTVPGPWRPRGEVTFELLWDREKSVAFEVLSFESTGDGTRVRLRSANGHSIARKALNDELAVGQPVALVKQESSYESFGFPKTPWMLGGARA
ncbi:MAG: hypothetical protein JJ863_38500 [Deltaproteobacteria bacterium]|nr:hypothetical protein [Deltaproteobacteria bacterium]